VFKLLVQVSRIVAILFYLIGIIGAFTINGKFSDFNQAMEMFFETESFSEVTGLVSFIFFLSNVAIGIIIHLLGEILNQTKFSNVAFNSKEKNTHQDKVKDSPVKSIKESGSVEKTFKEDNQSKFATLMVIIILIIPVITFIFLLLT